MKKTNALRLLDRAKIPYRTLAYDSGGEAVEAQVVAQKIGMPPEQVFKTLVALGDRNGHAVFVIPGPCNLDLRKAAKASGDKRIDLIAVRDLQPLTGYVRGGCSPIGMTKPLPAYIDESCELFDEIAVSAGVIGMQMVLKPADLLAAADARLADLV